MSTKCICILNSGLNCNYKASDGFKTCKKHRFRENTQQPLPFEEQDVVEITLCP